MEFVEVLQERKFEVPNDYYVSIVDKYRQFEPFQIKNGYWLSIQASFGHYCKPRTTLKNLSDYTHWEMAIFNEHEFVRVNDVLPQFQSLAEIEHYFDSGVYSYVPADLIEELYQSIK